MKSNRTYLSFLSLVFYGILVSFASVKLAEKPTLFIIGDSTVKNGQGNGDRALWGWGNFLPDFFDLNKINIENRALGGTSTRTFQSKGLWDNILLKLKPGDYVLMQFGHNDGSPLDDTARARGTIKGIGVESKEIFNPITNKKEVVYTYGHYLRKFINDAKAKGATPIVCSPVPRNPVKKGVVTLVVDNYANWAEEVANAEKVSFIPLNKIIKDKYGALNAEKVQALFTNLDGTHTSKSGAKVNAASVVEGLRMLKTTPLIKFLNDYPKHSSWPAVEKQMKPWTRWWWMGNAVDEQSLSKVLTQYQAAGIGGMEITPIYGAKGFEERYIDFLSPKWMNMLQYTVQKANALGMGVDMNTGTGWPFGGPQVKPENAATKLIVQQYELKSGQQLSEPIKVKEAKQDAAKLQAVTAYGSNGKVLDLTDRVHKDGVLSWKAGKGDWQIYAVFAGKTRQEVKRAAPGGSGLTMDHLDKSAVINYLQRFDDAFQNKPQGIRSFFNDSYEVYGANWTPSFFDEFEKRRGYDLKKHIKQLVEKDANSDNIARLKSDYRETMSDLLLVNFTHNWTDWAHKYGSMTKNQSHGSPGNILDLYGAVDIPETETFGSSYFPIPGLRRDSADIRNVDPDPMMCKFPSSAAHTGGKNLVSSETFTWLTEHFKTAYSQCKPEAEQLFLSGVNHLFYHGTTNSPDDAVWPGWLFYASVEFTPANSLWPQFNGLNDYVTRCQSVLQAGKADNEVLMYWPVYDVWNQAKGMDMAIKVHNIDNWLHPTAFYKLSQQMAKSGYSFDFASDKVLAQSASLDGLVSTNPDATAYKVLVIPACKLMSLATLEKAIQLAKEGATVIFQQLPNDVPGLNQLKERRNQFRKALAQLKFTEAENGVQQFKIGNGVILLSADVEKALAFKALKREELTDTGLQFIRRSIDGGKYYYIVNHTAKDIDSYLPINQIGKVLLMDPQSGAAGLAATSNNDGQFKVHLQIRSGESMILKIQDNMPAETNEWVYLNMPGKAIELTSPWSLDFTAGGPDLPASQKLDRLVSWTSLADPKLQNFSGTGVYNSTFTLKDKTAKEYLLQLQQVDESARVWINGQEVGILWSIPFQARVGNYLKAGTNTIKIEVVNLMANRIRYMDQQKIQWRNYHEINFVNIDYKPFDAANWTVMPSGLIGPVTITPYN